RLKHYHVDSSVNFRSKGIHHFLEVFLRAVEHTEIVERAPATEMTAGDANIETGVTQDSESRLGNFRVKEVVKSIRPEKYRWPAVLAPVDCRNCALRRPALKCLARKARQLPLTRNLKEAAHQ